MSTEKNASASQWVGRQQRVSDIICLNLCQRIAATFDREPLQANDELPLLWHWAFFQEATLQSDLGADGHAKVTDFNPGVDGKARMWAGGRLEFVQPLKVGAVATRESSIIKVTEKEGKSGQLIFVTVLHEYYQHGALCIREEHDIVYRPIAPARINPRPINSQPDWSEEIMPDPTLLFRYSAVTFNGHRIHYDQPYVTKQEGYADLVVHGPLIATLMVKAFTDANPTLRATQLSYRGLSPLTANASFRVEGKLAQDDGIAELWACNDEGLAHQAEIRFEKA